MSRTIDLLDHEVHDELSSTDLTAIIGALLLHLNLDLVYVGDGALREDAYPSFELWKKRI